MELVLVLFVIGAAAYLFFKSNTKRGIEAVRAHIFLGGIHAGSTVDDANHAAIFDMTIAPPDLVQGVIQSAVDHLRAEYGGKQLRMIADAYQQGMRPNLPVWYRAIAGLHTRRNMG